MKQDDDAVVQSPRPDLAAPELFSYVDPIEGFRGWLAVDRKGAPLVAGGFRVRPEISSRTVRRLAGAMTLKQRLLGLGVGGAKCGIAYDPGAAGKEGALRRFFEFLRPWLEECYSMGPDMGTSFAEIEAVAQSMGVASVKLAAGRAQGLSDEESLRRLRLLETDIDGFTLSQRRAGHGLAHAVLAVLDQMDVSCNEARVGILGFGSLGRGGALALDEAGIAISAVADRGGSIEERDGLDVSHLLSVPNAQIPPEDATERIFATPLDVLVLAGGQDAISPRQARTIKARAVVSGANLALGDEAALALWERGITVVPDFVGGCAGSASMDGLFGPDEIPQPRQVLDHVARRVRQIIAELFAIAAHQNVPLRQAALEVCRRNGRIERARPYGHHVDNV